jgi:hypothetical protein
LPWELTDQIKIPYTHVAVIDRVIVDVNRYLDATGLVYGQIFFTAILSIIGFGLLSVIYAVMYRVAGPPRYGPFDIPPSRVRR